MRKPQATHHHKVLHSYQGPSDLQLPDHSLFSLDGTHLAEIFPTAPNILVWLSFLVPPESIGLSLLIRLLAACTNGEVPEGCVFHCLSFHVDGLRAVCPHPTQGMNGLCARRFSNLLDSFPRFLTKNEGKGCRLNPFIITA